MKTPLGYDKPLFIIAFDHRASFKKDLFGIDGDPTPEQTTAISDAKRVIFEGLEVAVAGGAPLASAGALVDEQFAADIARDAKAEGFTLAMSVEKSGQPEFDFEFGENFAAHTIWSAALKSWLAKAVDRRGAAKLIADKYLSDIVVYQGALSPSR